MEEFRKQASLNEVASNKNKPECEDRQPYPLLLHGCKIRDRYAARTPERF